MKDESAVEITGLAYGGAGIGRIDGKVVFIPFTAPGDIVRAHIVSEKKGFSEARLIEVIKPSPMRRTPACPVYSRCGGCHFQHIDYSNQLSWKQKILEETVKRIARIDGVKFDSPAGSLSEFNYRVKARFQVKGGEWGFFEHGSNRVVDVDSCPIVHPLVNDAYGRLKAFFLSAPKALSGLSSVEVGLSGRDNRAVALIGVSKHFEFDWQGVLKAVGLLKGIEVWLKPPFVKGQKRTQGERRIVSIGDTGLLYDSCGVSYSSGISVFSQANHALNQALVEKALEYAGLCNEYQAIDLFAGAGNITLPAARLVKSIIGVESDGEAVKNGAENAALNSISNAAFTRSDALGWIKLRSKKIEKEAIDVVFLDPPRAGGAELASALSELRPRRIVYVSCSPPTLARDLAILARAGYGSFRACLFDMFPQTYHMECVVGMERPGVMRA